MISTFGSLMGSMLASPRIFFAMADDKLLFEPIARVHPKWKTPHVAISLACVLGVAMVMTQTFEQLTDTFVLAMWPFYALSVGAIYTLRKTQPNLNRPTKLWVSGSARDFHCSRDLPGGECVDHRSEVDVDHVRCLRIARLLPVSSVTWFWRTSRNIRD